jgi:RHS repeat-associated protein
MKRLLLLAAAFLAVTSHADGQNLPVDDRGLKPFASYAGGNLDSVNMANGSLTLHIPFWSYPQRGGKLRLNYFINFTSNLWKTNEFCGPNGCYARWQWIGACGTPPCFGGAIAIRMDQGLGFTSQTVKIQVGSTTHSYTSWSAHEPSGAILQLAEIYQTPGDFRSFDGSGILFRPGTGGWSRDGIKGLTDPNGNYITTGSPLTDTLGRSIPGEVSTTDPNDLAKCDNSPLATTSATVLNLPAPNDGTTSTAKIILCYVTIHLHKDSIDPNFDRPFDADNPFIQNIVFPNGTKWKFEYQANEGNLTKMTLPTGGSISYSWGADSDQCTDWPYTMRVVTRTLDAGDGTPARTWTYQRFPSNHTATYTDPAGNDTTYAFRDCIYETQRQTFQGSSTSGTLLQTVQTQYQSFTNGFNNERPIDFPTTITTIWPNGASTVQSKVVKDLNGPGLIGQFTWQTRDLGGIALFGGTGLYGNIFDVKEYDNGTNAPGSLMRETVNTYKFTSDVNYKNNNFLDLLASVQVKNGSGAQVALTTYGYDEAAYPLQTSGITTQHTNPAPGTPRGNQTSVNRWLNTTGTYLSSHRYFYDTGTIQRSIDPLNNTTTYVYGFAFAGAYPTEVDLPTTHSPNSASHVTYTNYDFNSGVALSKTDENGRVTNFTYDLLSRPATDSYPDGGLDTYTYNDTTPPTSGSPSVQIKTGVASGIDSIRLYVVDGLGRLVHDRHTSDPEGTVNVDTTYDELGRKATVTNPYRSPTGESTNGTTQYQYDALGRTKTVIHPDLTTVNTVYSANCTTVTDEAGKGRKSCSDGLGRATNVYEAPTGVNYQTVYQYDTLGNLTCVEQHGTTASASGCAGSGDVGSMWRVRRFTYDSLSRLLSAKNPETGNGSSYGIINYSYDADGNMKTKQSPAPNQTGTATVTITYNYDEINRLTSKTYSDGSPAVYYGYDGGVWSQCTTVPPTPSPADTNPLGYRTTMCDSSGATAWTHDNMGRPLQDNRKIIGTAPQNKVFTYTYNLDGSLATLKYPSTRIITYETSTAGRTISVKNLAAGANYVTAVTYAPQGAVSSFTFQGGIKAALSYNSRLQPLQMFYGTNTPPVITGSSCPGTVGNIMHRVYHFGTNNNNGNVQSIDNCRDTSRTANYQYDSMNRITQGNSTGPEWGDTYVVDAWGNLTNMNPIAGKTNVQNLQAAPASWKNQLNGHTHDSAGNLLSDGVHSYTYDNENRLASTNGWIYVYDGDGERVKKCNSCGTSSGGTLYFPSSVAATPAEFDLAGTLKYEYIFFNGERIAKRDGTTNPPYYYFADHLKSTSVLTNSTGAIQNESDYFAYGGEIVLSNLQPQNYKFNGKERDAESGLDEFGARYFGNAYGRFMQTDWSAKPAAVPYANYGNPQSLNLFAYVENNPTTLGDPDGHCGDVRGGYCDGSVTGIGPQAAGAHEPATSTDERRDPEQNNQQPATVQSQQPQLQQANTIAPPIPIVPTLPSLTEVATGLRTLATGAIETLAIPVVVLTYLVSPGTTATSQYDTIHFAHRTDERESTRPRHEEGEARRARDRGGEKGDARRRYPRKPPDKWKTRELGNKSGKWPPTSPRDQGIADRLLGR